MAVPVVDHKTHAAVAVVEHDHLHRVRGFALRRGGFEQVILLGAGFDARAHRLPCLAQMPVFEVDHPNTLEEKRHRIDSLSA